MSLRFCPQCAAGLIKKQIAQRHYLACSSCDFVYGNNPIPAAGCLIENGGHVLLIRRKSQPHGREWSLPVGFLHFGENAEQAAVRIAIEGTGLHVQVTSLLGTYNDIIDEQSSHLVLIFRSRILGGELRAGDEVEEVAWFSINYLPPLAFASTYSALETWKAGRSGPPIAYYFCPRCQTRLERRKIGNREHSACPTCDWIHWINPIPIAETIITNSDGEVLLVKRKFPPGVGYWALPGGFLDWGESAEAAAIREAHEETGLEIKLGRLLCTLGLPSLLDPEQCILKTIFLGEIVGGILQAGDDALEARFFAWQNLPENLATESTRMALMRWHNEQ